MNHETRYEKTLNFITGSLHTPANILDIGTPNPFSEILRSNGFSVMNTTGEDLDDVPEAVSKFEVDAVVALEILEHLINPLTVLRLLKSDRIFATVPLNLWFAKAYRNKTNQWDQHFHEFEDWQFDWLLEKAGWEKVRSEKWTSPVLKPGIRPILRSFTPRYYAVEARRKR